MNLLGAAGLQTKFEILSTKSETNSKLQKSEIRVNKVSQVQNLALSVYPVYNVNLSKIK